MTGQFKEYYENYHREHGANGYRMDSAGVRDTSRVRILVEWVRANVKPGAKILDVGCGDMYLSKLLPEYVWSGIDIATDHAPTATKHDLSVVPYPFRAGEFEAAICSEVLEHVFDPRVIHHEVNRLLAPGGAYIVSTPNFNHLDHFFTHFKEVEFQDTSPHFFEHIRWYGKDTHVKLLSGAGFSVLKYSGADAHFSHSMQPARRALVEQGLAPDLFSADVILGKCFPDVSHTVMLLARKGARHD